MMVGRDVVMRVPRVETDPGRVVLRVNGVGLDDDTGRTRLSDITFTLREGEILGIAGVDGNGQCELAGVVTGMLSATRGEILLMGEEVENLSPLEFKRRAGE